MTVRLLLVLGLVLATLGAAQANEVDDRGGRVTYLERETARVGGERDAMARQYDDKAAAVAALKARPASWARDRKLQALLADSKDMAARLDRKDAELRALAGSLTAERRGLIAAIDAELAGNPAPVVERAAALARRRGELVTAVGGRPLHVPEWTIEPGDDVEDLSYKMAALAQSERDLLTEEARLGARVAYFRKQAKLARSRVRADAQDVFGDEEPRRGNAPGKGDRAESATGDDAAFPSPTGPNDSPPPLTGSGGTSADPRALDLAVDPSVILADVVATGTLDELRRAERSGDPESMAKAAERAGAEVEGRAARLRALRALMEQRAAELRGEKK